MQRSIRMPRLVAAAFALIPALSLGAQQANPSVAAYGMGNNYTAAARGYETIGWNPALLALPGQPKFSLGGFIVGTNAGIGPISVQDLADYSGATIPTSVRQAWVNKVRANGTQNGNIDGGLTILALSWGKLAAQVSASGGATMNLNGDALETIFLGNADAVAANRILHPSGSVSGSGFITTAVSYSKALPWKPTGKKDESFALGLTGKYVMGAGYLNASDNGSSISKDTLKLRFPVILSTGTDAGSGMGLDLGAAWHGGNTTIGLTLMNAVNSFAWDGGNFECTDISADVDANRTLTNTDEVPCTGATMTSKVNAATNLAFKPAVHAGVAYTGFKNFTITGDVGSQMGTEGEAIIIGSKTSIGVGAEYTGLKMLPLRAGFSSITGGTAIAGGAGLRIGSYELSVSAQLRNADGVSSTNLMVGLISFR